MYFNLFAVPVYISLLFLFIIFIYSLKNRQSKHMYYFVFFSLTCTIYSFFYSLELSSKTIEFAEVFYILQYIGIPFITSFYLLFVLKFTGKQTLFKRNMHYLVYLLPIFTSVSVLTSSFHEFHVSDFKFVSDGPFLASSFSPATGYWIFQFTQMLYMGIAFYVLLKYRKLLTHSIRKQINILIISSTIPFVFYILYLLKLIPFGLDPVPFAFLISAIIIIFGLSNRSILKSNDIVRNALFDNIDSAIVLTDMQNRITDINNIAERKLNLGSFALGLKAENVMFFWQDMEGNKTEKSFQSTDSKSGRIFEVTCTKLKSLTGDKIGNMYILYDVTENVLTTTALKTSEENYKDIIDNATDLIQSVDKNGNFIFVNKAWKDLLKYTNEDLQNLQIWDIIHHEELLHCQQIFEKVIDGTQEKSIETVFVAKDGKKIWVEGNINCKFSNSELLSTRGIFRDISEKVEQREYLNAQIKNQKAVNNIFALFIDTSYDEISKSIDQALEICLKTYELDRVSVFRFSNDYKFVKTTNISSSVQVKNNKIGDVIDLENNKFTWWNRQVNKYNYVLINDVELLPKEAESEKMEYKAQGLKSLLSIPMRSERKVIGFIGFDTLHETKNWLEPDIKALQIITEIISKSLLKAEADEYLRKSKEQFQLAVDGSNDGIWDWDLTTNNLYLSPKWKNMIGYEDFELNNSFEVFESMLHPEDEQIVKEYIQKFLAGEIQTYKIEFRFRHRSGYYLWILAKGEGIRNSEGRIIRMAGSHTNITKEYEEKLLVERLLKETGILIKSSGQILYNQITDSLKDISGAAFVAYNQFDQVTGDAITIAYSGLSSKIESAMKFLGFNLKNKRWKYDQRIHDTINNHNIYTFRSLAEMSGSTIGIETVNHITRMFNLGSVVLIKVSREDKNMGYFTLIFDNQTSLKNEHFLALYANYVGLYIDRNNSIQGLVESEHRYRELIENAGTSIFVVRDKKIIFSNSQSLELLGFSREELMTKDLSSIVVGDDFNMVLEKYNNLFKDNTPVRISPVRVLNKKSELIWLEFNAVVINWDDNPAILSFASDITERIIGEQKLKNKQDLLKAIAESTDALLKHDDYLKALEKVFEFIGNATNTDRVYLFNNNFDTEGNPLRICSQKLEWSASAVKPQINNPELQNISFEDVDEFIGPLERFEFLDIKTGNLPDCVTKELLTSQDIVSILVFPLIVENKFWGFIGLDDCKSERDWSQDEFSILQSFAGSLSSAIERKFLLTKLNESVEIAQKASKAKSDFLANMSHEIRTPLNGVIGYSDLLSRTEINVDQLQYVNSINQSATTLLDLINDILDFSKIEAGKLELNPEVVNLHSLIEQVTDILKYSAHVKDLEILINIKNDVPVFVISDYVRLRQILINLISNAIKFTTVGEVEIVIEAIGKKTEKMSLIKFTVRDTGEGFDETFKDKIFDSFTQGDSSITKRHGGTGLGLTIVNRLLGLMNSELNLISEKGKGSTFWFELELEIENTSQPDHDDYSIVQNFKTAFVVDDNLNNLNILKEMLNLMGVESSLTDSPKDALESLKLFTPSMAIIDYNMPEMDGITLIDKIRNELKISPEKMPIIFLHSSSELEMIPDLLKNKDINLELVKPLKLQQLKSAFELLHKQHKALKNLENRDSNSLGSDILESKNSQKNYKSLKILIAEDNPTNMMLAKHILKQISNELEIIEAVNGIEAFEMFLQHQPDLVFMDIHMPKMSGYDAAIMIRNSDKNNSTPIIALTAGTLADEKLKSIEVGMNDYLSKPVVLETIKAILEKYIVNKKK